MLRGFNISELTPVRDFGISRLNPSKISAGELSIEWSSIESIIALVSFIDMRFPVP